MVNKYNLQIGDRVRVLDEFNPTALGKVGTIIANRESGYVIGFFCGGVHSNYELEYFVDKYPGLKATWWYRYSGVEPAIEYTQNKFK